MGFPFIHIFLFFVDLQSKIHIYDRKEKYVIVLECQRKNSYYLLTAYYLNKDYAEKSIYKKMKKRLPNVI